MEEFFLHLWDDADDMYCACRHVAGSVAAETLSSAAPLLAAISGAVLAGTTAAFLARHALLIGA